MRIIIEFDGGAGDMPGAPERVAISDTREAKLVRRILDVIGKYDRGDGVLKKMSATVPADITPAPVNAMKYLRSWKITASSCGTRGSRTE